jgi:hypothetical protein
MAYQASRAFECRWVFSWPQPARFNADRRSQPPETGCHRFHQASSECLSRDHDLRSRSPHVTEVTRGDLLTAGMQRARRRQSSW